MARRTIAPIDRIMAKVERRAGPLPTECWVFCGGKVGQYGSIGYKTGARLAHRVMYSETVGPIPSGMCVLHKCDTPACVNPAHLFVGTVQDNVDDCVSKDRHTRGELSPNAKMNDAKVLELRERYSHGEGTASLAKRFGINQKVALGIATGVRWRHLPI